MSPNLHSENAIVFGVFGLRKSPMPDRIPSFFSLFLFYFFVDLINVNFLLLDDEHNFVLELLIVDFAILSFKSIFSQARD